MCFGSWPTLQQQQQQQQPSAWNIYLNVSILMAGRDCAGLGEVGAGGGREGGLAEEMNGEILISVTVLIILCGN